MSEAESRPVSDTAIDDVVLPFAVEPDRMDAQPLRRLDFPFQVVANHPSLLRLGVQRLKCVRVGAFFRLAETVLAFDLDMREVARKIETLDLLALPDAVTVRDERKSDATVVECLQRLDSAGVQVHFLITQRRVAIGDRFAERDIGCVAL